MKPKLTLAAGKERSLERNHLWVFSGAVKHIENTISEGAFVDVFSSANQYLGSGFYQKSSITVRIITRNQKESVADVIKNKIALCFEGRKLIGFPNAETDVYRLVHGEGDELPGLVVDIYANTAVIQLHASGWLPYRELIAETLVSLSNQTIHTVYDKSAESLGNLSKNNWLIGEAQPLIHVKEFGHAFEIDVETGQKTGFFIDQRYNRKLLGDYSKGKKVLNTFCYSGGFSVYALKNQATQVLSIDSSKKAIQLTDKNVALNGFGETNHQSVCADVLPWLTNNKDQFDVIVLDPPAFAKHQSARHKAIQAYKRLNLMAMQSMPKNGILFTFSCSQVVDPAMFRGAVMSAAIESGRQVQILHQLSQPADHPINIYHPEGEYLKGLVLRII